MQKAEIVFDETSPLTAHCSVCKNAKFTLSSPVLEHRHRTHQESDLGAAFQRHCIQAHLHDDRAEAIITEAKKQAGKHA